MSTAVSTTELSHTFGPRKVIRDLDMDVFPGEFFIIIGPNGSGKTTLIKLLMGLIPAVSGEIRLLDRDLSAYSTRQLARKLAYVPQTIPAGFSFTVSQTVLMGRAPHLGILGIEKQADMALARSAMEMTDVMHLAKRRLDRLSGGERQRVFIARAICQEPEIIMLDEPTAALDLAHQGRIMDLMTRLKEEKGVTVVMVSHDLNLAAMYADRLMLVSNGKVSRIGTPAEVLTYETLEPVYQCTLLVEQNRLGTFPQIQLVPGGYLEKHKSALGRSRGD